MTEMTNNTKEVRNKDCLACKLIGTVGLFGISAKVFYDAASHSTRVNRVIMNSIGAGIVYVIGYELKS